jgi:hypothetical protein
MSSYFEQVKVGERFKTIGKITRNLSLYTYEKTEVIMGRDEVPYNAVAFRGQRQEKRMSFHSTDEVEIQK